MLGVGPTAAYQAKRLTSGRIPYRLLLDPERRLSRALDLQRQSLAGYVFNLRAWLRWLRAFAGNRRQFKITGHYSDVPAVAVVTPDLSVTYLHRGTSIGDYPPLDDALTALSAAVGNRSPS